jgi:hypothetical protein
VYFWYRNRRLCQTEFFSFISYFIQDALWRIWFRKSRNPFAAFYGTPKFIPLFTRAQSVNQSNAHLHSYTQYPTESNFLISRFPVAGFQLLAFVCCVTWHRVVGRVVPDVSKDSTAFIFCLTLTMTVLRSETSPTHTSSRRSLPFPCGNPAALFAPAIFIEAQKLQILAINIVHCLPSSPIGPDISICFLLFLVYTRSVNWIQCSLFMSV